MVKVVAIVLLSLNMVVAVGFWFIILKAIYSLFKEHHEE